MHKQVQQQIDVSLSRSYINQLKKKKKKIGKTKVQG